MNKGLVCSIQFKEEGMIGTTFALSLFFLVGGAAAPNAGMPTPPEYDELPIPIDEGGGGMTCSCNGLTCKDRPGATLIECKMERRLDGSIVMMCRYRNIYDGKVDEPEEKPCNPS
jgi:hypothetical protein